MTLERIPLVDLDVVHRPILGDLRSAFDRVMASSAFIGGEEVEAFEAALADHVGTAHAVGVGSGTAALQLALAAAGIGPGDEVILPANTFVATAEAVVATGAMPVLVDVDERTALIDLDAAADAVTARTAAVIPVHLYGQPVDGDAARELASRRRLFLLEDAAQAIGAEWRGRRAGSIGDAGAFSFYPGKNLGALGDGGAITTDDAGLARRARLLRSHGEERRHLHRVVGYCERLDGLQAAFPGVKLARLDEAQKLRDEAAGLYEELLRDVPNVSTLLTTEGGRHVHHLLVVRVPRRDAVLDALHAAGVGAAVHYPTPIHLQPAFAGLGRKGAFPVAESLSSSILSLPLFPGITPDQVRRCVGALRTAVEVAA